MNKIKNKSHLKSINLKSLILVVTTANSVLTQISATSFNKKMSVQNQGLEIEVDQIKEKISETMSTNIKRLEKVRNRVISDAEDGQTKTVQKIDEAIKFMKAESRQIKNIKKHDEVDSLNKKIIQYFSKNDINLGKVFDGRKDQKKEKFYNKIAENFREIEKNIQNFSGAQRDSLVKIVQKGYHLIEQLKNEEKYNKAKAETKKIRKELANCYDQIRILYRYKSYKPII